MVVILRSDMGIYDVLRYNLHKLKSQRRLLFGTIALCQTTCPSWLKALSSRRQLLYIIYIYHSWHVGFRLFVAYMQSHPCGYSSCGSR